MKTVIGRRTENAGKFFILTKFVVPPLGGKRLLTKFVVPPLGGKRLSQSLSA
jgi:hypothetical protein